MTRRTPSPFSLFLDTMMLGLDAQAVIAMRGATFASGRTTTHEAARMMNEKGEALFRAHSAAVHAIMTGKAHLALPAAVAVYGRATRANRRRLSRMP